MVCDKNRGTGKRAPLLLIMGTKNGVKQIRRMRAASSAGPGKSETYRERPWRLPTRILI